MRKAAQYCLVVVCVCLVFALSGPSAQRTLPGYGSSSLSATGTVGFVGVTTETFPTGVGALVASRACNTELPLTRLCEWADLFRSIPPPALNTDVLVAQNYEVNPRTTCITSDGGLKCKPGALLPAACCGSAITSQILLNIDTTSPGCSINSPIVTSCVQQICLLAHAQDTSSPPMPVSGLVIAFKIVNTTGTNTFTGVFQPTQVITDVSGNAATILTPGSDCAARCTMNQCIGADVIATAQGGLQSAPLHLIISIP